MSTAERILQMAARPEGVGTGDIDGVKRRNAFNVATRLVKRGELFLARVSRSETRFFTCIKTAAAAERLHIMPSVQVKDVSVDWRNAETITPDNVKVTVCPTPPERFTALSEFHPLLRHRAR